MKKALALILSCMMLIPCVCSTAEAVDMYSKDGRQISVADEEVNDYKKVGWYENKEDVLQKMYSMDGRKIVVYKADVDKYSKVGWYENKKDVLQDMYSDEGVKIVVFKSEIEEYKKSGWHENKEDVIQKMYSMDGREITVFKADVERYKKVGWYEDEDDVTVTVCSSAGRKKICLTQLNEYLKKGWVVEQSDVIDPEKPMVALTYDDGPRVESTGRILDTLENYNVRATFFVVGRLAAVNKKILKRAYDMGCVIGNHTYSHPDMTKLTAAKIKSEISTTSKAIYNAIGKYPDIMRPPYGAYNETVMNNVGSPVILWSVDTLDWKYRNANHVYNHVMSHVKDGDIILMHDLYDSTAEATERIVPALMKKGYQLVTVEELAKHKGKNLSPKYRYSCFR